MQHCMASPQQFCLRWNNYQSNLTNVFDQLLQSESFVDVTLACDGHSVKAHKMVLSACSPYFQSLFFDNPCQHPIVILKDIKWPELKAVVEFMYKGEINVSQEQIGPLLKVAESLKIRGLADVNGEPDSGPGTTGDNKKAWEPRPGPTPHDLTENAISPATTPQQQQQQQQQNQQQQSQQQQQQNQGQQQQSQQQQQQQQQMLLHRQKKRRRTSGERSSISSPEESLGAEGLETSALELSPQPPPNAMVNSQGLPPPPPPQNHPHGPTLVPIPGDPGLPLPPPPHPDDMEIKPGIAEMIREEERVSPIKVSKDRSHADKTSRSSNGKEFPHGVLGTTRMQKPIDLKGLKAKLLESSHAWLGASTSSLADCPALLKLKAPTWTQAQLKEAIHAVVTQKMRFTQASTRYGIPKGTLYDNILGKSKRMVVLEEAGLTPIEEQAVLEFCCEISIQPYNRRTKKSLASILAFVEKLRRSRDPEFQFTGLAGFRWWWAFCKKHSIVSLYFDRSDD